MKSCFFDIECSGLKSNFAVILCGGIKPVGKAVESYYDGRKGSNDKDLCRKIADRLREFDIIITYYGLNFDMPFLNSRLIKWGLPPVTDKFHIDVYRLVKKTFNIHSRRAEAVAQFLGIEGKTPVVPEEWMQAAYDGDWKALSRVVQHNKGCVTVTEGILGKCKHVMRSISKA